MANKALKTVVVDYDLNALVGVATLEPKAIDSLMFEPMKPLNPEATYVILRQWIHIDKIKPINGIDQSQRIYYLEILGNQVRIGKMSYKALIDMHLGSKAEFPDLTVSAGRNQAGLLRAIGATYYRVFPGKGVPFEATPERHVYVKENCAFKVVKREDCWHTKMVQTKKGWEVLTKEGDGGTTIADLGYRKFYTLELVDRWDAISVDDLGPEGEGLRRMQENLPD